MLSSRIVTFCIAQPASPTRYSWMLGLSFLVTTLIIGALVLLTTAPTNAATTNAAQDPENRENESRDESDLEHLQMKGSMIYRDQCLRCHGESGEGVEGEAEDPLHGDRPLSDLIRVITDTMPDGEPDLCVGGDAEAVATFMYHAFYTAEAREKGRPPRIELSRMTVRQYQNSVADVMSSFLGRGSINEQRGLNGTYFNSRGFSRKEQKINRVDPQVDFDFGEESPDSELIETKEFSMTWKGSVITQETGDYEFIVRSQNGVRLNLNGQEKLIDGWVNSGETVVEHRESVFLLGGRAYPIELQFFSFEDDTASVQLKWKPPQGVEEVIPNSQLTPTMVQPTFVVTTGFPPDDSSVGYARGTSVSKLWDEATTFGAIEAANFVVNSLDRLTRTESGDENREAKTKEFCARFLERAFRRPLSDDERRLYLDSQFESGLKPEIVTKRVVILALKSPRFLYVEFDDGQSDSYDVASRLSFGLWDSVPDDELLRAAQQDRLKTREQIEQQVRRMLNDDRTRAKIRSFFHEWLPMDEAGEISKDEQAFPGFDDVLIADLRHSLELFVDDVVWSDGSDYRQLLLSEELYLNRRLAEFYGIEYGEGEGFKKLAAPENTRAGVLTHPLLMASLAYHRSSSPIHRGVFVTRSVLSRALNPPPEEIEFLDDRFDPDLTMREKVTQLTEPAACQSCHRIINPLGFSLENYDAVGRYRTEESDKPIDPNGTYETLEGNAVELTGPRDLAHLVINENTAHEGFVEHLFHETIKQPARAYGDDTLTRLTKSFQESEFSIRELLVEIMVVGGGFEGSE